MASTAQCSECSEMTMVASGNSQPLCEKCKRKHGWKPWEEMTLEEKVEDLNKRLNGLAIHHARF